MVDRYQYPVRPFSDPQTQGDPETVKLEDFYRPFSEPVRKHPFAIFAAALIAASGAVHDFGSIGDAGEVADTSTEWIQPLSEPVWQARRLSTGSQQHFVIDPTAIGDAERVKIDEWLRPWPEKVWPKSGLAAASQQAVAIDPTTIGDAERVKIEDWWQQWSAPVSIPPPLQPDSLAYVEHVEAAADETTEWWRSWPEHARPAPWLDTAAQQHVALDHGSLGDPETVKLEDFWQPLSEPVRTQPRQRLDAFTYVEHVAAADISTEWLVALSEPIRAAPRLQPSEPAYVEHVEAPAADTSLEWFAAFSEPLRLVAAYPHATVFSDPPLPAIAKGWWPIELEKPRRKRRRPIWEWPAYEKHPIKLEMERIAAKWAAREAPPPEPEPPVAEEPERVEPKIVPSWLPAAALFPDMPSFEPIIAISPAARITEDMIAFAERAGIRDSLAAAIRDSLAAAMEADDEKALLMLFLAAEYD